LAVIVFVVDDNEDEGSASRLFVTGYLDGLNGDRVGIIIHDRVNKDRSEVARETKNKTTTYKTNPNPIGLQRNKVMVNDINTTYNQILNDYALVRSDDETCADFDDCDDCDITFPVECVIVVVSKR
jgi:hypothetical protein